MQMLLVAAMIGLSVFLLLLYFESFFAEKNRLENRMRRLREEGPDAAGAENLAELDFSHHRRSESRSSNLPLVMTLMLIWMGGGFFVLSRMDAQPVTMFFWLLLAPLLVWRAGKIISRRSRIDRLKRELPGALDLIVVCLEAGLALNPAFIRIANELEGSPLGRELRRTSDEITAGIPFEDALRGLAKRTQIEELNTVVSSVIQAEKMGSSLALSFRVQSEALREKYKGQLREKINKVPIKILFPLVFFLFPALFVVILGPTFVGITDMLRGLG